MNLEDITAGTLESVADLMNLSDHLRLDWADYLQDPSWAFRGQAMCHGTLQPSFARLFKRRSPSVAQLIERELINAFRSHYASLPGRTPDMPQPQQLRGNLRTLSVMQHYEVPTRLLDWSTNLWTAVYFACASQPGEDAELWAYSRRLFDTQHQQRTDLAALAGRAPEQADEPIFIEIIGGDSQLIETDPRTSPRMLQQKGHHTASSGVFDDHAPLLHALAQEFPDVEGGRPPLQRWIIRAGTKDKALRFLAEHRGIDASTLFPDVVGLGRYLHWQLDALRTMLL